MAAHPGSSRAVEPGVRYDRHPAEIYDRIVGPILVLVGILGFIASASFSTGSNPPGSDFIVFEVDGWHNLVHIASGLLLCVGIGYWGRARPVTLLFGMTYLLVALVGWIDGNDVIGWFPVDLADNVLHTVLALSAIAVGLAPAPGEHFDVADTSERARTGDVRPSVTSPGSLEAEDRFTRGGERVAPEPAERPRR